MIENITNLNLYELIVAGHLWRKSRRLLANPFRHTRVRVDNRLEVHEEERQQRQQGQLAPEQGNEEESDDFEDDLDDEDLDELDDDDILDDFEDDGDDEDDEDESNDNTNVKNDEDGAESDDSISVVYCSVVKKPVEPQPSCSKVEQNFETPHIKTEPMVRSKQNLKECQLQQVEMVKPNNETVRENPGTSQRADEASKEIPTPTDSNRPGTSGSATPSGRVTPDYVRIAKKICENRKSVPMPVSRPRRNPPRILRSSRFNKEEESKPPPRTNSKAGNQQTSATRSKGSPSKRKRPPVSSPIAAKKRAVEKTTGNSRKRTRSTRDESHAESPNKRRRAVSKTNQRKPEPRQQRRGRKPGVQAGGRPGTSAKTRSDSNTAVKPEKLPETPRGRKLARNSGTSFGEQMNTRSSVAPIIQTERSLRNNRNNQGTQDQSVVSIDDEDSRESSSHTNDAVQTDERPPNKSSVEEETSHKKNVNEDDDDSVICIDDDDEPSDNQGKLELPSEVSKRDKELQVDNTESHKLSNRNSVQTNEQPPEHVQNWQSVQPEVNNQNPSDKCQGEQKVQFGDAPGEDEAPPKAEEGAKTAERAQRAEGQEVQLQEKKHIVPENQDEQRRRQQFKQDERPNTEPKTEPNTCRSPPNDRDMQPQLFRLRHPPENVPESYPPKFLVLRVLSVPEYTEEDTEDEPYITSQPRPKSNTVPALSAPAPTAPAPRAPAPRALEPSAPASNAPAPRAPAPRALEPSAPASNAPAPKPNTVPTNPAPKPNTVSAPNTPALKSNTVLTKPAPKCKKALTQPTPRANTAEREIPLIDLTMTEEEEDEDEEEEQEVAFSENRRKYSSGLKQKADVEQVDDSDEEEEGDEEEGDEEEGDEEEGDEEEGDEEDSEEQGNENNDDSGEEVDEEEDEIEDNDDEEEGEEEEENESEMGVESLGSISIDTSEYDGEIESAFELLSEEELGSRDKNKNKPQRRNQQPATSQQAPITFLAPPGITITRRNAGAAAWKAGPLKAIICDGNVIFECCAELWPLVNAVFYLFIIHIGVHHPDDVWDGKCSGCSGETTENRPLPLIVALKHLILHIMNAELPEHVLFPLALRVLVENDFSSNVELRMENENREVTENNTENVGVSTAEEKNTDAREPNNGEAQEGNFSTGGAEEETPNTIEGCSNGDENPGSGNPNVENDQNVEDIENSQNPENPNPEIEEHDNDISVIGLVVESPNQEYQINYISPSIEDQFSIVLTPVIPYVEYSPVVDGFVPSSVLSFTVPYEIYIPVCSNVSPSPGVVVVPLVIQPEIVSAFSPPFVFQPSLTLAPQLAFSSNLNPVYISTATIEDPNQIPTLCSFIPLFPFDSSQSPVLLTPVGDGTNFVFVTTEYNTPGTDGSDLSSLDTSFQSQSSVGESTNPVPDSTSYIPSHSENPETDCIGSAVYTESSEPTETQNVVEECTNTAPDDTSYIPSYSENPETDCINPTIPFEPSQTTDEDSTNYVPFVTGPNSLRFQFLDTGDSDLPVYVESSEPVVTQSLIGDCTNPVPDGALYTPPYSENTDIDYIDSSLGPFQLPAFQNPDSTDSVSFVITPYSFGSPATSDSDPFIHAESSESTKTQSPVEDDTNPVSDDTSFTLPHFENPETDFSRLPFESFQTSDGDNTNYVLFATASNSVSSQFPETADSDPPVYAKSSEPTETQNVVGECTNTVPDDTSYTPLYSENPETDFSRLPFESSQTTDGTASNSVSSQFPDKPDSDPPTHVESSEPTETQSPVQDGTNPVPDDTSYTLPHFENPETDFSRLPFESSQTTDGTASNSVSSQFPETADSDPPTHVESSKPTETQSPVEDGTASNSVSSQFPDKPDSDRPVHAESSEPVVSQSTVRDSTDFVPIATTSDDLSGGQSPARGGSDSPVESSKLSDSPSPVTDCMLSIPDETTFPRPSSPFPGIDWCDSPPIGRFCASPRSQASPGNSIDFGYVPMSPTSPVLESPARGGSSSPLCVEHSHLSGLQSPVRDSTDFIPSATTSNSPRSQTPDKSDSNSPVPDKSSQPSTSEIPEPTSQSVISSPVSSQLPKDNICPIHFTHSAVIILDRTHNQISSTVSPERYELIKKKLHSVRHNISERGVTPNLKTLEFLQKCSPPSNFKQLQNFVRLSRYCRRFVKNFSEIVRPLNEFLRQRYEPFIWTETEQNSFMALKRAFATEPILHFPDFNEPLILATECSCSAISSVLSQGHLENGRVLGYGSRDLAKSEVKFSTTEKELLAITWAVKHFNLYLEGQNFTIVTSHEPLAWLISCETLRGKFTKRREQLLQHNFKLIYCDRNRAIGFPGTGSISSLCDISEVSKSFEEFVEGRLTGTKAPKLEELITKDLSHTPYVLFFSKDMNYTNPLSHYVKSTFDITKVNESEHLYDVVELDNGVRTAYICLSRFSHEERLRYLDILCSLISLRTYLARKGYSGKIYIHDITTKYKHIDKSTFSEMILFAFKQTNVNPVLVVLKKASPSFLERPDIIQEIHRSQPDKHFTSRQTFDIIKERYRWRTMKTDVFNYIKRCRVCKKRETHSQSEFYTLDQ